MGKKQGEISWRRGRRVRIAAGGWRRLWLGDWLGVSAVASIARLDSCYAQLHVYQSYDGRNHGERGGGRRKKTYAALEKSTKGLVSRKAFALAALAATAARERRIVAVL